MLSHPPAIKSSLRIREGFSEELVCVVEGLRTTKQPEIIKSSPAKGREWAKAQSSKRA